MTPSSLLALLAGNAKLATAVAATAAVTAGGGMAVASAVTPDNTHAAAGLARAADAQAAADHSANAADVQLPTCPADVKNHGAYVSSVAKTKPAEGDAPNAHGKLVAAAAQSDCGKPASSGGADDANETDGGEQGGPSDKANDHATNHPSGKPDTAGQAATHGKAGEHLPTG